MEFPFWAIYLFDCLRRIVYLLWEDLSGWKLWPLFRPAQAKFVVCDYTIENGLQYRRDRSFREDDSQLRMGHAPHVLATLNNTAWGVFARHGQTNLPHAQRTFAYQFDRAL